MSPFLLQDQKPAQCLPKSKCSKYLWKRGRREGKKQGRKERWKGGRRETERRRKNGKDHLQKLWRIDSSFRREFGQADCNCLFDSIRQGDQVPTPRGHINSKSRLSNSPVMVCVPGTGLSTRVLYSLQTHARTCCPSLLQNSEKCRVPI